MRVCFILTFVIPCAFADTDGCMAGSDGIQACPGDGPWGDTTSLLQQPNLKKLEREQDRAVEGMVMEQSMTRRCLNVEKPSATSVLAQLGQSLFGRSTQGNARYSNCPLCEEHPHCPPWSQWTEWSDCCDSRPPGVTQYQCSGVRSRTRDSCEGNFSGGAICRNEEEAEKPKCCKDDCKVGDWNEWSPCDAKCGPAKKVHTRSITQDPYCKGAECPPVSEERQCETGDPCEDGPPPCKYEECCPCVVGDWEDWGSCDFSGSQSCGNSTKTRHRKTVKQPDPVDCDTCPPLEDEAPCTECCPEDCELEDWTDWSPCTATCGDASKTRTRGVKKEASCGGKECPGENDPERLETPQCDDNPCCPVHPECEDWEDWGDWTAPCAERNRVRQRNCTDAKCGGIPAKTKEEDPRTEPTCTTTTTTGPCDCTEWQDWSCSTTCGTGTFTRTRTCDPPGDGSLGCDGAPLVEEEDTCPDTPVCCPENCVVCEWSDWSDCSATCGEDAKMKRVRDIIKNATCGGEECPPLEDEKKCDDDDFPDCCPEDGKCEDWSDWSACSATCGESHKTRSRSCSPPKCGGAESPEPETQTEPCDVCKECPSECVFEWTKWGDCSKTCGPGKQTRKQVAQPPAVAWDKDCKRTECEGTESERECKEKECCIPCEMSQWSDWSNCATNVCSNEVSPPKTFEIRTRNVTRPAEHCEEPTVPPQCGKKVDQKQCPEPPCCACDCEVGPWEEWGAWDTTCGEGTRMRLRHQLPCTCPGGVCPYCGGKECPKQTETEDRNPDCPTTTTTTTTTTTCEHPGCTTPTTTTTTTCVEGDWEEWGDCSVSCGKGTRKRSRDNTCTGPEEVSEDCFPMECPEDCVCDSVSEDIKWLDWSGCNSELCGWQPHPTERLLYEQGGVRTRKCKVLKHAQFGGKDCEPDKESCGEVCPDEPICECTVSDWTPWGDCTATCEGGTQTRTREVVEPFCEGAVCPCLEEQQPCNTQCCPVDCEVGPWEHWSQCPPPGCGGSISRIRSVSKQAQCGGDETACKPLQESQECQGGDCDCVDETGKPLPPEDCWSPWTDWSCSVTCGVGTGTRSRIALGANHWSKNVSPEHAHCASKHCDKEQEPCKLEDCPPVCLYFDWGDWSACDPECTPGGVGVRVKNRKREVQEPVPVDCECIEENAECDPKAC